MRSRVLLSSGFIYYVAAVLFLYMPIALLVLFSFNDSALLAFPIKGLTLRWYREMMTSTGLLASVWNSVLVGLGSSLVATVLGSMAAIGIVRYRFPGRGMVVTLTALPFFIPSIVFGVALLVLFRQVLDVRLSLWGVAAAHVIISIPTTVLIVAARLVGFPRSLEEAALDLGATRWQALWRVVLPICTPSVVAAFLTAFTTSFDEYAMSVFVMGTNPTLPVYLYSLLRFPRRLPVALAMGSAIIILSMVLIVAAEGLRRLGDGHLSQRRTK
jgi:spermidine/putrescine transport system permease protein